MKLTILPNKYTRKCSECRAGERREIAVSAVRYRNDNGRTITVHVCSDHAEMLLQDHDDAVETVLLPRTWMEARVHVPEMTENLLEIVAGRRVGIPTLAADDVLCRAAGILSGKPVEWYLPVRLS